MKIRTISQVKQDFKKVGVEVKWLSAWRLTRYSERDYQTLLRLAQKLGYAHLRLKVGRSPKFPLSELTTEEAEKFLEGKYMNVLNLKNIESYLEIKELELLKEKEIKGEEAIFQDQVRDFLSILVRERNYFDSLVNKPGVSVDKLFRALAHGLDKIKSLGLNATIFRPISSEHGSLEKCKWSKFYQTERWEDELHADPKLPQKTLLSVLKSTNSRFEVDLQNLSSFRDQGLEYDLEKIKFDLENSKGSSTFLIFKLDSLYGTEAVVYIGNRVAKSNPANPPEKLFSESDRSLIIEELNLYFDSFIKAVNKVRAKEFLMSDAQKDRDFEDTGKVSSSILFEEIRKNSEQINFKGAEVRLIELPSEKLYYVRGALVKVYKELIISIYRDSEEYKDCTDEEIIKALSLDNEAEVIRKTFLARYLPIILDGNSLLGVASGNVEDHVPEVGKVFEIPVAMIKSGAKGMGMLTYISYQMIIREFWKKWIELGFLKGFYKMLVEGVPIFAWTQSRRVIGAMLELSNLWLPGKKEIPSKVREIIYYFSQKHGRPLDENFIARNIYRGRIALRKEEDFKLRKKGIWGLIEKIIFPGRYKKIEELLNKVGDYDTLPVVGFFTIWVALKMGIYMRLVSLYHRLFRK